MDDLTKLFLFPFLLFTGLGILLISQAIKYLKKKKTRTIQAKVLTKKIKRAYDHKLARVGVSGADWLEYYAVFKPEKGKAVELQLPKEIYDSIEENDKGQLTFNDYKFISFDKNSCYFVHSSQ